jgi:hypothetical protein
MPKFLLVHLNLQTYSCLFDSQALCASAASIPALEPMSASRKPTNSGFARFLSGKKVSDLFLSSLFPYDRTEETYASDCVHYRHAAPPGKPTEASFLEQPSSLCAMAEQAQCAEIVEVALAAALGNRQNVICIPKSLPDAFRHAPVTQQVFTFESACVPELAPLNNRIELA